MLLWNYRRLSNMGCLVFARNSSRCVEFVFFGFLPTATISNHSSKSCRVLSADISLPHLPAVHSIPWQTGCLGPWPHENMEDMDPDTLDSISIGAIFKRETVMEEVKLLCAFVEEELSWIVQFFHDVLNKEVTASSGKIGRIWGGKSWGPRNRPGISLAHQFMNLIMVVSWATQRLGLFSSHSQYFQGPSQQPHKGIQGLRLTSTLFSNNLNN